MVIKKIAACVFAAVLSVAALLSLPACAESPKKTLSFLTADGELVKNEEGETVSLRGINAGGLLVTEHWMTGFKRGSSPSNDYRSLTQTFIKRFGEEKTKALWAEYRANWWTDADFEICADMGMNVIRLPFTYMNVDFDAVSSYDDAGKNYDFSVLDSFVEKAASYGMYTILDLHGAYGSQNGQDHSGEIINAVGDVDFYSNEEMQNLTVKLWGELSEHYKDNGNVAGYDILNEPGEKAGSTSERHWIFYDKVYEAIRATGDGHIVIFESCWDGANLPAPSVYGWENCMYSFHHYADDLLSATEHNVDWNAKIANVTSQNFGVPLQMGEFTSYTTAEKWEYTLDLLNRSNWHWTSWTYKVWGSMPWGVVNIIGKESDKIDASKDSYEDILEKFKILRTDGESTQKYTFYNWNEKGDMVKYKTLEEILTEYCNAPLYTEKLEEGDYVFTDDDGWLSFSGLGETTRLIITNDYNNAYNISVKYNTYSDGSANLSADGKYLTAVQYGNEYFVGQTNYNSNNARFYPVAYNGGYAFVSYTVCKYLRVGEDGVIRVDADNVSAATLFYIM